jgi:hypothetical protein
VNNSPLSATDSSTPFKLPPSPFTGEVKRPVVGIVAPGGKPAK